jgi:hypothetical protein
MKSCNFWNENVVILEKRLRNSKRSYLIELLSRLVNEFSKLNWQSYEGGVYPLGSLLVTAHPAPHTWESGCIWVSWMWLGKQIIGKIFDVCTQPKKEKIKNIYFFAI